MYNGFDGAFGVSASPQTSHIENLYMAQQDSDGYVLSITTDNSAARSRIFMVGPKRSGKSSIQQVVFQKRTPNSTLFMQETSEVEMHHVQNNAFVNLEVWDFPGDFTLQDNAISEGKMLTDECIFNRCGALVYVIDMKTYETTVDISTLVDWVSRAHAINPKIYFEILLHKFDAELNTTDFAKSDIIRDIEKRVCEEFESKNLDSFDDIQMNYHLTSIYDHTLFELFSHIVQKLFHEHAVLEDLLQGLVEKCNMDKAFLFDVASKIYIAENPPALVDSDQYELSADMIDVVIDILCIYGGADESMFDAESSSVIRLSGGRHKGDVLYLRQVSSELAIVCILRADNFQRQGLIDHNIDAFKKALKGIVQLKQQKATSTTGYISTNSTAATKVSA